MPSAAEIKSLVDTEVEKIADSQVGDHVRRLLVQPKCELRPWNYQGASAYPCWIVISDPISGVGVAYSDQGFGPKAPWGLLWIGGGRLDMGDESCWFTSLEEAFRSGWVEAV